MAPSPTPASFSEPATVQIEGDKQTKQRKRLRPYSAETRHANYKKQLEKNLQYNREYYQKNREKIREYRQKNREKYLQYNRNYYQENTEKIQKYRQQNREKYLQHNHTYYQKNRDTKIQEYYRKIREKMLEYHREYRSRKLAASGLPPPKKYYSWKSIDEIRNFFEKFSELHFIKQWPEDWYRISLKQVELAGGMPFPQWMRA
jgi:hypothetical protein